MYIDKYVYEGADDLNKGFWKFPNSSIKFGKCDVEDGSLAKRLDDEPVVIKRRLKIYNKLTKPLADYYKNKSMLVELDANCSPQEVRDHTLKVYEDII